LSWVSFDNFSWMSTNHIGEIILSLLTKVIFLFIRVKILEIIIFKFWKVSDVKL